MNKPPLGLMPRHFWLRSRVIENVNLLSHLQLNDDWEKYRCEAKEIAQELLYSVTEWEKYYK